MLTPVEIISWQTLRSPRRQASQKTRKSSLRSSGFSSLSWPAEMACASFARAASISYFFLTSIAVANIEGSGQSRHVVGRTRGRRRAWRAAGTGAWASAIDKPERASASPAAG